MSNDVNVMPDGMSLEETNKWLAQKAAQQPERQIGQLPASEVYGNGSALPSKSGSVTDLIKHNLAEKEAKGAEESSAPEPEQVKKKTYPFPTQNGFTYESEEDEALGIESKTYDNGSIVKQCTLSDGRVAKCRRLKGKDLKEVGRLMNGDEEKYREAVTAICTTVNDLPLVPEDLEQLWLNDYTTILQMAAINFPTAQNR